MGHLIFLVFVTKSLASGICNSTEIICILFYVGKGVSPLQKEWMKKQINVNPSSGRRIGAIIPQKYIFLDKYYLFIVIVAHFKSKLQPTIWVGANRNLNPLQSAEKRGMCFGCWVYFPFQKAKLELYSLLQEFLLFTSKWFTYPNHKWALIQDSFLLVLL